MTFTITWADVGAVAGWGCGALVLLAIGFVIGMALFAPRWG